MKIGVFVEKEWRVKKARSTHASNSPFVYKIRQNVRYNYRKSEKPSEGNSLSTEVMLKVTGGCKSRQQLGRKLEYDTREYTLPVMDEQGISHTGKSEISDAYNQIVNDGDVIPRLDYDALESAKKQTHSMMFSAPKSVCVERDELLECTRETLNNQYPKNSFLLAYHDDSGNPHVHAILKISDSEGKRIRLTKDALRELRRGFCEELQNRGYHVTATYRHDLHREKLQTLARTANQYTVVDFGKAPYQFGENKPESFFVKYQTQSGQDVSIWGKSLEEKLTQTQVEIGDKVTIRKGETVKVHVPMYDSKGTITHYKETERNVWEVENLTRPGVKLEKPLVPEQQVQAEAKREQQLRNRALFEEAKAAYLNDSGERIKPTHPHEPEVQSVFQAKVAKVKDELYGGKAQQLGVAIDQLAENRTLPEGLSFKEKADWLKQNQQLAKAQKLGIQPDQLAECQVMPGDLSFKEKAAWIEQNKQLKRGQDQALKQQKGMSMSIKIKRD